MTPDRVELELAAAGLLDLLEEAMPAIDSAIVMSSVHGAHYEGPDLSMPMDKLRVALGRPSHQIRA